MARIPQHNPTDESLDAAVKDFETHGCIYLKGLLPVDRMMAMRRQFAEVYEARKDEHAYHVVSWERRIYSPHLEGEFADSDLYAHSWVMQFMERLLGKEFVLGNLTSVTSFPGAIDQHRHRDCPGLFGNNYDFFTPSFGINLFVPLVDLNAEIGSTRMWPGTHRRPLSDEEAVKGGFVDPEVRAGDAVLMDYRVLHQGMANQTDRIRPLLCLGYQRPWFLDTVNFHHGNSINLSDEEYERIDPEHQWLFSRVKMKIRG